MVERGRQLRIVAAGLMVGSAFTVTMALQSPAHANRALSFASSDVGKPPAVSTSSGAVVRQVTVGGVSDYALGIFERSSSARAYSRLRDKGYAAKQFSLDLNHQVIAPPGGGTSTMRPTILTVHGDGYHAIQGKFRFLLQPVGAAAKLSVFDGRSWLPMGRVPGIYDARAWHKLEIDTDRTYAVIKLDGRTFRTSVHASAHTGTSHLIDDLEVSTLTAHSGNVTVDDIVMKEWLSPPRTSTIAGAEPAPREGRFPSVARLKDGRLIAVYESAYAHRGFHLQDGKIVADSRIRRVYSSDNGATWSAPQTIITHAAAGYVDHDPTLVVLANGQVLVTYHRIEWVPTKSGPSARSFGVYTARSTDAGRTFTTISKVTTNAARAAINANRTPTRAEWAGWGHGNPVQLANGTVLLPYYTGGVRVARSTNSGASWEEDGTSTTAILPDCVYRSATSPALTRDRYEEPSITVLPATAAHPTGEWIMTVRVTRQVDREGNRTWDLWDTQRSVILRSFDRGATWSLPAATGCAARFSALEKADAEFDSHDQILTSSGKILVAYGVTDAAYSPHRPTWGMLVSNPSGAWTGKPRTQVYDAAPNGCTIQERTDQANPAVFEVSTGRFLTLTYDVNRRRVVGFFSTEADYRADSTGGGAGLPLARRC